MRSSAGPTTKFPWIRYWAAYEHTPLLDEGFLLPSGDLGWGRPKQTTELHTLESLAEVPCLILLGGPGLGKTHELAKESERLVGAAGTVTLHVDFKGHGPMSFREAVFDQPEFEQWKRGEHPSILTEARRAQMVDLYFEQVRRHEAEAQDGKATLPLSRLKHAGLPRHLPPSCAAGCRAPAFAASGPLGGRHRRRDGK